MLLAGGGTRPVRPRRPRQVTGRRDSPTVLSPAPSALRARARAPSVAPAPAGAGLASRDRHGQARRPGAQLLERRRRRLRVGRAEARRGRSPVRRRIARRRTASTPRCGPEGRYGALVRSLDSYAAYWERWARPWEFQALMKARYSAGDADHGPALRTGGRGARLGRGGSTPTPSAELRAMKARDRGDRRQRKVSTRARDQAGPRRHPRRRFAVQLLQLVHGGRDPALRLRGDTPRASPSSQTRATSAASDAAALALAYRFLRTVEHRLQLVEEAQVHTVPSDRETRDRLARVLGFRRPPEDTRRRPLRRRPGPPSSDDAARSTSASSSGRFSRPSPASRLGAGTASPRTPSEERLARLRLPSRPTGPRQALDELTSGLTRIARG